MVNQYDYVEIRRDVQPPEANEEKESPPGTPSLISGPVRVAPGQDFVQQQNPLQAHPAIAPTFPVAPATYV